MRRPPTPLLAIAAAAVVALAGCGLGGNTYADLDRDPGEGPALPPSALDDEIMDRGTARWVGEYAGADVWISEGIEDTEVCVGVAEVGAAEIASSGCGYPELTNRTTGHPGIGVVADGQEPEHIPSSAIRLSDNVFAWGDEAPAR